MITIQIAGKTYQTKSNTYGESVMRFNIEHCIGQGYLEEVKENKEQWTPTIGKKLQVSIDGKKWTTGILEGYDSVDYEYPFRVNGGYWKYAKPVETKEEPQPQEEIEFPGVPYYCSRGNKFPIEKELQEINSQIEALTKFCKAIAPIVNQLITNKKLGK